MTDDEVMLKIWDRFQNSQRILLVTHYNPDGDALSSLCSWIEICLQQKKDFFAYCYSQLPHQFNFLPHFEKISNDHSAFNFEEFDLIISLDCGSIERTKLANEIKTRTINQCYVEIDHHLKIENFADLELRQSGSASTTEVLYRFYKKNKIILNQILATCLLTGLSTDTGNFIYYTTSQETIEIASDLMLSGGRLPQIVENTWRNKSLAAIKLWGVAMARLKINPRFNLAFTILTQEDFQNSGVSEEELEGISGFISNLSGVNGVLILRESSVGLRGSLRTIKLKVDISKLAKFLGGGGHAKASGFSMDNCQLKLINNHWQVV